MIFDEVDGMGELVGVDEVEILCGVFCGVGGTGIFGLDEIEIFCDVCEGVSQAKDFLWDRRPTCCFGTLFRVGMCDGAALGQVRSLTFL